MIKTFEQFVSVKYDKPVNEAFQSSKLREIIKQHGKPKYSWENKMLYDLKDDEIIDVLDSRDEYWKKYSSNDEGHGQATFKIELEDGKVVVISNLGILKNVWDDMEKRKEDVFKQRHSERHKGNLGKGGDEIHKKHLEKVDELEKKRFAEKIQHNIPEIVEAIKSEMNKFDSSDFEKEGNFSKEFDITLDGDKYTIIVDYEVDFSNDRKNYGAYFYDIIYSLTSFYIENDEGYTTDDVLGITENEYGDLFEPYTIDDVEGEIYDHYEYYGVSPSDFF